MIEGTFIYLIFWLPISPQLNSGGHYAILQTVLRRNAILQIVFVSLQCLIIYVYELSSNFTVIAEEHI